MTDAPHVVPTPAAVWTGRDDGPGEEHRRWHHLVRGATTSTDAAGGVALVGFASDEGVRRNRGRLGAVQGPDALRRALASMAVHPPTPRVVDAGTVVVHGEDLETAQDALGEQVGRLLDRHDLVVVLGGGHESAWGSYLGRAGSQRLRGQRVGVLNLDAHFDLRRAERPTSGTPFRQMADADAAAGRPFAYTVLGIAEPSNTEVLFADARELGVRWLTDDQCTPGRLDAVLAEVDALLGSVDVVHLSIDLDVLPAAVAPGVSAPAGRGVALETIHEVCRHVAASGKLVLVDVVELLPRLDVDGRTARTAARLIDTIVRTATSGPTATSAPTAATTHQEDQ